MADSDSVNEAARDAFEDAHRNLDADLALASTPSEARAVQNHHDTCLANYMVALRTAFSCSDKAWTSCLTDARQAQQDVDEARQAAEALPRRLAKMTTLAGSVSRLIKVAT